MAEPIHFDTIRTKKELLRDVSTVASLDRGCSLTKILYIPKEDNDPEYYDLRCATFLNNHFVDSLIWLSKKGHLPSSGEICVTGVGSDKFRDLIEEKIGLKVRFVDEMFTIIKGNHFLIKHFPESVICYPKPEIPKEVNQMTGLMKWIGEQTLKSLVDLREENELNPPVEGIKFPAMIGTFGSAAAVYEIREDGSAFLGAGTMLSGRTLIGLGKLLLDTTNYDEIIELAEKGCISSLVKTAVEHQPRTDESQYGQMYNFPLFPFGGVTPSTKLHEQRREDIALSLLQFIGSHLYFTMAMFASIRKINRVYFSGNLTRAPILQKIIYEHKTFYGMDLLDIYFLNTGHAGAIGAMISKPQEDAKFETKFF